jgi:hypothetical protein
VSQAFAKFVPIEAQAWTAIGLLTATLAGTLFYLGARIDALGSRLDARIDALTERIDALGARLDARLDALTERIDDHLERHAG